MISNIKTYDSRVHHTINDAWLYLIDRVYKLGATHCPRQIETKELLGSSVTFDMRYPMITIPERKLSYKFLAGEAWWILSGRNDLESILKYNDKMERFSGNGTTLYGAYGVRINDQFNYVIDKFIFDHETRQAVFEIWKENPKKDPDIPCTVSVQYIIRDNKLYCIDTMRSSDTVWGFCYDAFNFSMLALYIVATLRELEPYQFSTLKLGTMTFNAGSQHIYAKHYELVEDCLTDCHIDEYDPFTPELFTHPENIISWLKYAADSENPYRVLRPNYIASHTMANG